MSKKLPNLLRTFSVAFLLLMTHFANGQITYPTPAAPVSRGLESSLLTIKVVLPATGTDIRLKVDLGATNNPGRIEYVANSVNKVSGILTIKEFDVTTDKTKPVFEICNGSAGASIEFTILRKANCGTASATKDFVTLSGTGITTIVENAVDVNTYNLLAPALTLIGPETIANASLGSTHTRTLKIKQGGNGCAEKIQFWIKNTPGSIQINSLAITAAIPVLSGGSIPLTSVYTNGDSTLYEISAGNFPGGDNRFCSGEEITLTENITILKCGATSNYGTAWGDFASNTCESKTTTGNITMANNVPTLTTKVDNYDYDYCFRGDEKTQIVKITNSGLGAAINVKLDVGSFYKNNYTGRVLLDTGKVWNIRNSTNTIIGQVSSFTDTQLTSSDQSLRKDANCGLNTNAVSATTAILGNISIPAGDYITVEVATVATNLSCEEYCYPSIGWLAFYSFVNYQNECGTASYSSNLAEHTSNRHNILNFTPELPTDILPNEPFELLLNTARFKNLSNPNGGGTTYLKLSLAGTSIIPNATSIIFHGTTYPVTFANDTVTIGPFQEQIDFSGGDLKIPLIASCGTGGPQNMKLFFLKKYSDCSPAIKMTCLDFSTTLHCPGCGPKGGATPRKFTLKRINYGLPDNDNNHIADATGTVDLSLISDHHSVNGDTLQGTWNINVNNNVDIADVNYNKLFKYVYVDFNLGGSALGQDGTLSPVPGPAQVEIYPAGVSTPITCTVPYVLDGVIAHYEIGPNCRTSDWQNLDSLVVKAKYTVNHANGTVVSQQTASGYSTFITQNEVYATYTAKSGASSAPIDGETYTCDHFNDYSQISKIWLSPYIASNQNINACSNEILVYLRQYVRFQEGPNVFPYEVRIFNTYDEAIIQLPPGFNIRPGSIKVTQRNIGTGATYTGATASQVGDIATISGLKNAFAQFGGPLPDPDENPQLYISFSVDPTCEAVNGSYLGSVTGKLIGNGVNTPASIYDTYEYKQTPAYLVRLPQPKLSGGGTVVSTQANGEWSVVLQNEDNGVDAANSYFYISPINGLTDIVLKEGTTVLTADGNGFYYLGDLTASATRNFTITANTSQCSTSDLTLNYGWGCNGYPSTFAAQSCTKSVKLILQNDISQIQLTVEKQPTPTTALCSEDNVIYKMSSSQAGYVNNPEFGIIPPVGLTIKKTEIEYPAESGTWQTVTPSQAGGIWSVMGESHTAMSDKGLPGTIDNLGVNERAVKLRITYETSCGFVSGSKLAVTQKGDRPCGGQLSSQNGYNNIVRTDPINITGVQPNGSMTLSMSYNNTVLNCGNTSTLSATITPVGTTTLATDTVSVNLPVGLLYQGNLNSTNVTMAAGYPKTNAAGTILKLVLPAGITTGNNIMYAFDIKADPTINCADYAVLSEVIRTTDPLKCGENVCQNGAQLVIGSSENAISVKRPEISITTLTLDQGSFGNSSDLKLTVLLANASTTLAAPANSLKVDFYCGTSATPFASQNFTKVVGVSASESETFTVPNNASCTNGQMITAKITPSASSCLCTEAITTINTPLPVSLIKFEAQAVERDIKLNWTVANEVNFSHYEVLKSIDGINEFVSLGRVSAQGSSFYNFVDNNPLQGNNYYQLKMIDLDRSFKLSRIIQVNFTEGASYTFVENPVVGHSFMINTNMKNPIFELLDKNGTTHQIQVDTIGNNQYQAKLQETIPGIYLLRIFNNTFSEVKKIVITK